MSGEVNMIQTLRKFRGGPDQANLGGASLETFSGEGQLKKSPCSYQIFLSSIALTAISNKDIVERLFVFQGKFVNTHVGDPAGTGSADRVPTVDHTGIIVLGVPTNLPHVEAADKFIQYFSRSFEC